MRTFIIDGKKLISWNSFHAEFKKTLNFPNYYGENMNAWIDCVEELTDERTLLQIENSSFLKKNSPLFLNTILECGAIVNNRKIEQGENPHLIISIN